MANVNTCGINNIILVWYCMSLLRKLYYVSQNTDFLLELNAQFTEHLTSLYELELYYGDQTLENLLEHARYVVRETENFNNIFSGINNNVEADADTEENNELNEEEELDGETAQ